MPCLEEVEATAVPPILRPGLFALTGATAKPTLWVGVKEQRTSWCLARGASANGQGSETCRALRGVTWKAGTNARLGPLLPKCNQCKLNRLRSLLPSRADKPVVVAESRWRAGFSQGFWLTPAAADKIKFQVASSDVTLLLSRLPSTVVVVRGALEIITYLFNMS